MYSVVKRTPRAEWTRALVMGSPALALVLLLWQGGCAYLSPGPSGEPVQPSPTPTVLPTAPATPQPDPTRADPHAPITLTLWLPPEMSLVGEGREGAPVVQGWNGAFRAAHARARLEVIPKAAYGPGGIVSMVLATHPVVPARLPDLIAFDVAEAPRLLRAGLLQPLDDLLPATLWEGMYPFAVDAATIDGRRYAVPFQADVDLLAFRREAVGDPPRGWDALLMPPPEGTTPPAYIFPATGSDGSAADALIVHYLALGGRLMEENGRPYLDSGIMARVLRSYRAAMDAGVVPEAVRRIRSRDDCWAAFLRGDAQLANATAHLYQRDALQQEGIGYAPLPLIGGSSTALARSWAWGVVTDDPARQALAAQYLAIALEPERVSAWCTATRYLPVQRDVLPLVVEDAPFRRFVDQQLEGAHPYPNLPDYAAMQAAIARAIEDVLDGLATPERAAVTAAATVVRLR